MQYDVEANRPMTDPDVDDDERPTQETDPDDGNEVVAEYSVVEESVVAEPDEQAAATDPRGGDENVWQGVQPEEGNEAVSDDLVAEDVTEDTHPTNVQPVSPDLGGVQPVDPDMGTGEPVDPEHGTDTPADPELADTGLDESDVEGAGPDEADVLGAATDEAHDAARTDETSLDTQSDEAVVVTPDEGAVDTDHDGSLDTAVEPATDVSVDEHTDTELLGAVAAGATGVAAADAADTTESGEEVDPLRARWHEAQHLFVDDPAQAVHEAATLLQEAAELASSKIHGQMSGDADDRPDTEQLRVAMQRYHEAFDLLMDISAEG